MGLPPIWRSFAVLLMFLLGACATPDRLVSIGGLERSGRFVAQVQSPGEPAESVQGGFRWQRTATGWQLDLLSPLGATLARLDASSGEVTLQQPGQIPRRAASASELIADLFGAKMPVDSLEDWIAGAITPGSGVQDVVRDGQSRVVSMRQDGWRIRFDRYDSIGPRIMEVTGTDQARSVSLRMVVDSSDPTGL